MHGPTSETEEGEEVFRFGFAFCEVVEEGSGAWGHDLQHLQWCGSGRTGMRLSKLPLSLQSGPGIKNREKGKLYACYILTSTTL